jgi:hypothetical protein
MEKYKTLPQRELMRVMKKFYADPHRGISKSLFADLAGFEDSYLRRIFEDEEFPMTLSVQVRVSKAYTEWKNGEVAIMQNRDRTKFVQYRKDAKPVVERKNQLEVVNGQIKLKIGLVNKHDYSKQTLDEQLERG